MQVLIEISASMKIRFSSICFRFTNRKGTPASALQTESSDFVLTTSEESNAIFQTFLAHFLFANDTMGSWASTPEKSEERKMTEEDRNRRRNLEKQLQKMLNSLKVTATTHYILSEHYRTTDVYLQRVCLTSRHYLELQAALDRN